MAIEATQFFGNTNKGCTAVANIIGNDRCEYLINQSHVHMYLKFCQLPDHVFIALNNSDWLFALRIKSICDHLCTRFCAFVWANQHCFSSFNNVLSPSLFAMMSTELMFTTSLKEVLAASKAVVTSL